MAGNRHVARSEATRARLVDTARRLFAERGYAHVSTEEIVSAAGVTRGALYHQFKDKADLFRAVFEDVERELAERLAAEALSRDDPWEAQLAGLDAFLLACGEPEIQRSPLLDAPSVLGWDYWHEIDEQYSLGLMQDALRAGMKERYFDRQPVAPLAQVLFGALNEAGLYIARAEDMARARREVGRTISRLISGLKATGNGRR